MLGINIITKSGILVFSHAFAGSYLTDIDMDMQAGVMTAVLNAFKETQGESIRSIQHRDYVMILYEGVLTNGILSTTEDDPKLHNFLKTIVLKFELMFTRVLHKEAAFRRTDFEAFRNVVKSLYSDIVEIDIAGLSKILDIMKISSINNYMIFETRFFHPVFTSHIMPNISPHVKRITQIFREINYFGIHTHQEILSSHLHFENTEIHALRTPTHILVIFNFSKENNIGNFKKEFNLIQKKLTE